MLPHSLITVLGQEISIGINNAMVLSNDLTLTERKLKCLSFGIIASEASFLVCSMVRIFYIFIIYNYVSGRTSCRKCSKRDPYSIYDVTGYAKTNHNYVICIYIYLRISHYFGRRFYLRCKFEMDILFFD